jgi:hypothetical protein
VNDASPAIGLCHREVATITIGRVEANPKGYNFQVHVTDGHEAEAKAAQMKKKPNRIGLLLLAMLGYRPRPRD